MKKMMIVAMMMTIAISANAMSYSAARNEALFLSDKMAYELGLTATQYEAVYEINLDYLLNVDNRSDVFGFWWEVRNRDLRYVLSTWQYDLYMASAYFYRPLTWNAGSWTFAIYGRYGHGHMFFSRPAVFVSFRGGHNHKGTSFYAGHHFDKPNPPKGHNTSVGHSNKPPKGNGNHNPNGGNGNWNHNGNGNHNPNGGNGNWNHNGNGNHNPNGGNGNWNHNGNGNHNHNGGNGNWNHNGNGSRPSAGNVNHTLPSGFGNGSSHKVSTSTAPSRTIGSRPAGNITSNGSNAPKGQFGGVRR